MKSDGASDGEKEKVTLLYFGKCGTPPSMFFFQPYLLIYSIALPLPSQPWSDND